MERRIPATVIAMAVLVIIATGIIVLTVMGSQDTDHPLLSGTGTRANLSDPVMTGAITTVTMTAPGKPSVGQPAPATGSSDGVIQLDPVSDRYDGEEYLITGTTSLPVGTDLVLQIRPDTGTPPTGYDKEAVGGGAGSTAWITEGNGTSNRVGIRGSMSGQGPGKWVAVLGNRIDGGNRLDQTVMGKHIGYAFFTQKPDPASAE